MRSLTTTIGARAKRASAAIQTPGARIGEEWTGREIWLRRKFNLKKPKRLEDLQLYIYHDEDAEVYLNGVLAAKCSGFNGQYETLPIRDEAARDVEADGQHDCGLLPTDDWRAVHRRRFGDRRAGGRRADGEAALATCSPGSAGGRSPCRLGVVAPCTPRRSQGLHGPNRSMLERGSPSTTIRAFRAAF